MPLSLAIPPQAWRSCPASFCVKHKAHKDRLITDKRCPNETEVPLRWLSLPGGPQFTLLFLRKGEAVWASADDFETYFYSVKAPLASERWNATGRLWHAGDFPPDIRGDLPDDEPVYFALGVLGMGGRNSMDVCQLVHEAMLWEADCLRESERLKWKLPPPGGPTWEGAYADDHVVCQRLTVEELRQGTRRRDTEIVEASVSSYAKNTNPL